MIYAKYIFDIAIWIFLLIRFIPFIRRYSDKLARYIYLGVLFSSVYATQLGIIVDFWVGEEDSEIQLLFALLGAFFFLNASFAAWDKFVGNDNSILRLVSDQKFIKINMIWLLLSFISFFVFEMWLGWPEILRLHTETFTIDGNLYLGLGRIISRSYIIYAYIISCIVFVDMMRHSFRSDYRLWLRTLAAFVSMLMMTLHYVFVSLGTFVVMLSQNSQGFVRYYYSIFSSLTVIVSGFSIGIFASPAWFLEYLIRARILFKFLLRRKRLLWIREYLLSSFPSVDRNLLIGEESRINWVSLIIQIYDLRRIVVSQLSDIQNDSIIKSDRIQFDVLNFRDEEITEALTLEKAAQNIKEFGYKENNSNLAEFLYDPSQDASLEQSIDFYANVSTLIQKIKEQ